jgi:hypothetical protein
VVVVVVGAAVVVVVVGAAVVVVVVGAAHKIGALTALSTRRGFPADGS